MKRKTPREPGVDAVEQELRLHGEVDDRCLLRGDVAAEIADEIRPPGGKLLPKRCSPVDDSRTESPRAVILWTGRAVCV